jgi:hypothetical protein
MGRGHRGVEDAPQQGAALLGMGHSVGLSILPRLPAGPGSFLWQMGRAVTMLAARPRIAPAMSQAEVEAPAPVEVVQGSPGSGVVLLCDHASNAIPAEYENLGLPAEQLQRHIAYDIGAAEVTRTMAKALGAPAVLSTFSRLLIDPNRGRDDPTLVMKLSDGAIVPGNRHADAAEIERRIARFYEP